MSTRGRCTTLSFTLTPFLYPSLFPAPVKNLSHGARFFSKTSVRFITSTVNDLPESRLNPAPDDYSAPTFADKAQLTLYAGHGGNGCVSFQREAFMPDGPPNGGDGGAGGNVYIQAAHGETSLHKLARRRVVRAGRGKHGQGSAKGGTRGDDLIITVPVGTIVRELERQDPAADQALEFQMFRAMQKQRQKEQRRAEDEDRRRQKALRETMENQDLGYEEEEHEPQYMPLEEKDADREEEDPDANDPQRAKWMLYPGLSKNDMKSAEFPRLPRRDRLLQQPPAPVYLDLTRPTPQPILLAAGGIGGLGNPHFTSRAHPRPMFATKGDDAVTMRIELELRLLADVGLVGLPNAGKSTLLRALTNSRTRVGNWAFTTLHPNIGTVVLDKYSGRPVVRRQMRQDPDDDVSTMAADPRTRFTVADIPGLIEGAHLDRGLGIAFLRHVERAGVLAFVIDLSAGNAVQALDALWREVGLYARMREEEEKDREVESYIDWDLSSDGSTRRPPSPHARPTVNLMGAHSPEEAGPSAIHIAGKPWFVVATKADLPETQDNFVELKTYLEGITKGEVPHPSGVEKAWIKDCAAIPVSAINNQGVDRIVNWTVGLLDE